MYCTIRTVCTLYLLYIIMSIRMVRLDILRYLPVQRRGIICIETTQSIHRRKFFLLRTNRR